MANDKRILRSQRDTAVERLVECKVANQVKDTVISNYQREIEADRRALPAHKRKSFFRGAALGILVETITITIILLR